MQRLRLRAVVLQAQNQLAQSTTSRKRTVSYLARRASSTRTTSSERVASVSPMRFFRSDITFNCKVPVGGQRLKSHDVHILVLTLNVYSCEPRDSPNCTIHGAQKVRQHGSHVGKENHINISHEDRKEKIQKAKTKDAFAVWYASGCDVTGGAGPAQPTSHHPTKAFRHKPVLLTLQSAKSSGQRNRRIPRRTKWSQSRIPSQLGAKV